MSRAVTSAAIAAASVFPVFCRVVAGADVEAEPPAQEGKPTGDAGEGSTPEEFRRPAFQDLRHAEDWSGLAGRDRTESGDFFDPIKFIPLSAGERVWLSLGGQGRTRVEAWRDFEFGGMGDRDDVFWLNRFLYHADLHAGEHLRVFAQGISAFSLDRSLPGGDRPADVNELDLQNGFVELRLPLPATDGAADLLLRGGRQELLLGNQRLVSPLDWGNTRRKFQGFSAVLDVFDWTVTGFWSQLVPADKYDFDEADAGTEFFGLYATARFPAASSLLDLYVLGLLRDASAVGQGFNGTAGEEDRYTLGARFAGGVPRTGFDYELETAYQTGELGTGDIEAYMAAVDLGYTFQGVPGSPRLVAGVDYASGDERAGGDAETFHQLFPLGHAYLGFLDVVGRQNVIDLRGGARLSPLDRLTLALDVHYFRRADDADALYNAGGGVVRAGSESASHDIGVEIDWTVKVAVDRHLALFFGYSHFFPGDFIEDTGAAEDIDWAYVMAVYTF